MENFVVGSTSEHKLNAVREACKKLGIEAYVSGEETYSNQAEQPTGFHCTLRGAINRARGVQRDGFHAIGIESGIFEYGSVALDIAIIAIFTANGALIVTNTSGIMFPEEYVVEARRRGFPTTTVGSVIAEKLGGDPTDPHSTLTDGKITRQQLLTDALVVALKQL